MIDNLNKGPIIRDGKTAIATIIPTEKEVTVGKTVYKFSFGAGGICMAWVKNEDVGAVMQVRKTCCGGRQSPMFMIANERQVGYWENGR